ncbi:hypothetical protein ACHAWF_003943 [Thalassiosira exigua]
MIGGSKSTASSSGPRASVHLRTSVHRSRMAVGSAAARLSVAIDTHQHRRAEPKAGKPRRVGSEGVRGGADGAARKSRLRSASNHQIGEPRGLLPGVPRGAEGQPNLPGRETDEGNYDASKCWEYFDLCTRSWKVSPKNINMGIQSMHKMDMSPMYMYKPGPLFDDAEDMEQRELRANHQSTSRRGDESHLLLPHDLS